MATDRWSLRNIYMYLVCLITLIMVIVGTVGIVRGTVELLYPDPNATTEVTAPTKDGSTTGMSAEEQAKQQEIQAKSNRRYAILNLVGNIALVAVAGPLYVYHWRKIEVEHGDKPAVTPVAAA